MNVAILGMAPGFEQAFEASPPYTEYWGLNDLYLRLSPAQLKKMTRWFELHPDTPLTRARRSPDHWASVAALHVPVYRFSPQASIPSGRVFPLEQAIAAGRDYFACTMAYQIALALSEGVTRLGLYGTPLCGTLREALVERPCVEWWLGLAEGRGVEVIIAHDEMMGLGRHPYRYADQDEDERLATYEYCWQHQMHGLNWLIQETERLVQSKLADPEPDARPATFTVASASSRQGTQIRRPSA